MTCRSWFTSDSFPVPLVGTARTFNICQDLDLDDKYCFNLPIPDLPFYFIPEETCYLHEVIEAILKVAKKPKSFLNRKGLSSGVAFFFRTGKFVSKYSCSWIKWRNHRYGNWGSDARSTAKKDDS